MKVKYKVYLDQGERKQLRNLSSGRMIAARPLLRRVCYEAAILLSAEAV